MTRENNAICDAIPPQHRIQTVPYGVRDHLHVSLCIKQARHWELLWKQYELHVDLYKFYMETSIKLNLFFYLITGGILTFYFANQGEPLVRYSLILPIVLSVAFSGIALYGAHPMRYVRDDLFNIRDELALETAPDVHVLAILLRTFAAVFAVVAVGMILLVILHKPMVSGV